MNYRFLALLAIAILGVAPPQHSFAKEGVIRVGIVGCDTSHVIAFTDLINNPQASGVFADAEVTIAYPGGSEDVPASRDRLPGFVKQLRDKGINVVDSLDGFADECDAILLESVDGRPHLEQFRAVAKGKPVFVDKPAAGTLADVVALYRVAKETNTPVFSSSSIRFLDEVRALAKDKSVGKLIGCETVGPMSLESHHPDLFWYGIHGVEPLFALMGPGCETVARTDSPLSTLVVGKWSDGRIGAYRGQKEGHTPYAVTVYGTSGVAHRSGFSGYEPAVRAICEFFTSGKPPVTAEETIAIYAFMEAADESKRQDGKPISVAEVLKRAEDASLK